MSVFYTSLKRPIELTMLLVEILAEAVESCSEHVTIMEAVTKGIVEAGLSENPTNDQILYINERLLKMGEEDKEKQGSIPDQPEDKKHFGQGAVQWMAELTPENLCLYLADYNYEKAKEFYCKMDREDVTYSCSQKMTYEWEMMRVQFEASLFGSGGGYGDGPKEGETVIDLTKGDTSGLDQFFGRSH